MVVAVKDRELGAVDGAQLIGRNAEHQRHEGIDLDSALPPILGDPQRCVSSPLPCDLAQVRAVCTRLPASPLIGGELLLGRHYARGLHRPP